MSASRGDGDDVSTAAQPRPEISPPRLAALQVRVIEGVDVGKELILDGDAPQRVLVGTSPACQLALADAAVSRRHFALEPSGKRYRITDLGSKNGTFVDGVTVLDALVHGGEIVRCGGTALRLDAVVTERAGLAPTAARFGSTIGASAAMRRLYPLCERLARSRVSVLIEGETGTGKEVLAESIHELSGTRGPFVVFDCTAVSPSLVEAELFGHERGAFTGAVSTRAGVFEQAHGGTLFVDEIGDLAAALQPKLLRAIDRGEVRRVGASETLKVEVRIVAATRRDLDREVAAGRFRDDLFHRLAIARIELPPLRDRHGDISLLARFFAEQLGAAPDALCRETLARFEDYAWPGNLRELKNAVLRRLALGDVSLEAPTSPSPALGSAALAWVDTMVTDAVPFPIARRRALEAFERRYVEKVLELHGGSVAKASAASGIARRYFQLVRARHVDPGGR